MKDNNLETIIVALDVSNKEEALSLVRQLKDTNIFKVGLQLFTVEGPSLVKNLQDLGKKVFLDLKFHDIPNTVAGAVRMGVRMGVHMMTLHASGGKEMMTCAARAAKEESESLGINPPLLLAVTVLTSLKDEQLKDVGIGTDLKTQVLNLAALAQQSGIEGIVCSPKEIEAIKKTFKKDLIVVAPGIRPKWAAAEDQKRILTPAQAVQKGADYLVIGRPITQAPSPHDAFLRILEELRS
ncbi:MAG: orotidine-5'-phosphate decarboxylase [Candidatus Aminicenantes bacterium]|nr:orotidine-5'-phosphate decarboxylase [Candidatus Aminicenantes bacterium]